MHPSCTSQKQRSNGGAVEKYTPPAAPHLTTALGGVVRPTWRESRRELTCLREQVQPSASQVLLCRGATHLNCPQPLLYLQIGVRGWEGQEELPPHPCTGHENGVHWSHPSDYVGAPPQAASIGSAQLHGERWLEPAQRSRTLAPNWLPASSWLERGFW